jgi:hypothetical protein
MEMEDYHGCCDGQQCWLSESIMVSNGDASIDIAPALVDKNGDATIDIPPALVDKNDEYASIVRRGQASLRADGRCDCSSLYGIQHSTDPDRHPSHRE